jgi:hypothetical protein
MRKPVYTAGEIPALIDEIFEIYRTKISSAVSDLERMLAISWALGASPGTQML